MLGKICFYSPKGWGFIRPDDTSLPDIYFHRSGVLGIHRQLVQELTVEFHVAERMGKPIAVNVRIPNAAAALRELAGGLLGGPAPSKDGGAQ